MKKEQTKFPSETIDLPSKGYFYSSDNILSSGKIELKYPTAREEDILTSRNLIQKGVVIDRFLESLVIDTNVNFDDVLIGDKNAIIYASRILAYGKDYSVDITCPSCGEKQNEEIDLNEFKHTEVKFNDYTKGKNEFEFTFPISKKQIKFRLLTHKDEKEIELISKKMNAMAKGLGINHDMTNRLKKMITEIDGNTNQVYINNFVDKDLLSRDSFALREFYIKITPDIDNMIYFTCNNCGYEGGVPLPLDAGFLWPSTQR